MKNRILKCLLSAFVPIAALVLPLQARAAAGDLYVVEAGTGGIGTVLKFTPDRTKSTFASGLSQPGGLAFDRAGNLFVVEAGSGTIFKFGPDGSKTTFASGLSSPAALAFDGAGNLFVTESFGDIGDILKFTPAGAKSTFTSGGNFLDLAFDASGDLFATAGGATDLTGSIIQFAPDGTASTLTIAVGPGIAFGGLGLLFAVDRSGSSSIAEIFPDGGRIPFTSEVDHPAFLALDGAGNLFVTDPVSGQIFKFTPDAMKSTFASGLDQPTYLAFEPVTEKLRNISARGLVGTGDEVLIGGFIVGGSALANNAVVVRALGPSLSAAGVGNTLQDPVLELHNSSGAIIAANDDWQDTQKDQIIASGLAPSDLSESTILATLPAGNYTAVVRGVGDTTGVALVEVYSVN